MIKTIRADKSLSAFLDTTCCENNICVTIEDTIDNDNYTIIKVDEFYNSLHLGDTPASVDCLIIRKCINSGYGITLVELKNISGTRFTVENLREKFETTLNDFIKNRYKNLLDIDYKDIKLYFVSKQEVYKRDASLKLEVLMDVRFKFNGKSLMIQPRMPTPTIKNCY